MNRASDFVDRERSSWRVREDLQRVDYGPWWPLIWPELALATVVGAAVGWIAHGLVRRRPKPEQGLSDNARASEARAIVATPPLQAEGPRPVPVDVPRSPISKEADTAGRVIMHLASLGRLGSDEVALVGHSQRGMTEALGIRQGTLAKVLSRLERAGVLEVDRRHVRGGPRRLKVYRLTALGESVAREIRHRKVPAPTNSERRRS